ncbi:hypothetical protein ACNPQM_21635 [Streptomyces sp. NPDC056231]|uniref:hypothetical protein n=1 Tax=Streptomyces sp. NPDC056231 TaxID=3345755 RepID=UPI003AAE7525
MPHSASTTSRTRGNALLGPLPSKAAVDQCLPGRRQEHGSLFAIWEQITGTAGPPATA